MKLITEAQTDVEFNREADKIQKSIEKLEKLAFSKEQKPVLSQLQTLDTLIYDLQKIQKKMQALRK